MNSSSTSSSLVSACLRKSIFAHAFATSSRSSHCWEAVYCTISISARGQTDRHCGHVMASSPGATWDIHDLQNVCSQGRLYSIQSADYQLNSWHVQQDSYLTHLFTCRVSIQMGHSSLSSIDTDRTISWKRRRSCTCVASIIQLHYRRKASTYLPHAIR